MRLHTDATHGTRMWLEGGHWRLLLIDIPEPNTTPRVAGRHQEAQRRRVNIHGENALRNELGDVIFADVN